MPQRHWVPSHLHRNGVFFVKQFIALNKKIVTNEYLQTEEGQQFARKVFDSAFDAQLEDKQELFINAFEGPGVSP